MAVPAVPITFSPAKLGGSELMDDFKNHRWLALIGFVAVIAATDATSGDLCKWIDEHGTVHYAESCPDDVNSITVEVQPPPSQAQVAEAERRSADSQKLLSERKSSKHSSSEMEDSLPLEELGPLPENTVSTYLKTTGTGVNLNTEGQGQFTLFLEARNGMPNGAYLEAHFPVPGSAGQKQVVEKKSVSVGDVVVLLSDESSNFKCWNYQVEVFVYADESKTELLDVHQQTIQSKFDNDLLEGDIIEFAVGMSSSSCPSGDKRGRKKGKRDRQKMSLEQLDALCEKEREKRLKPERESLIKRCVERGDKQDEWCQNYYADWGDAQRIDTVSMRPALYYNLPECLAAKEAREKSSKGR
jgi:hypothetical protein